MKRIIARVVFALLSAASPVFGHAGFDAETTVNLRADRMDIVIRMMPTQLLTLLGDNAPPVLDEPGYREAVPMLKKRAGSLYEVIAGDARLTAGPADVSVEGDGYIAVTIPYPRPTKWPLWFDAKFPNDFGPEYVGRISVYDLTASPAAKDPAPIAGAVQLGQDAILKVLAPKAAVAATTPAALPSPVKAPSAPAAAPVRGRELAGWAAVLGLLALLVGGSWFFSRSDR